MNTLIFARCLALLSLLPLAGQAQTTAAKKPPFVVPPDVNGLKTIIAPVSSQRPLKVAVFSGSGSPQSSVDAVVKTVSHIEGAKAIVLKGSDIGSTDLKVFDVIAFPGGSGSGQSKTLGEAGLKKRA